jgi:hypothetical protein
MPQNLMPSSCTEQKPPSQQVTVQQQIATVLHHTKHIIEESAIMQNPILGKEYLIEQNMQQQDEIMNLMKHCDKTKDKFTLDTSTLRVTIAINERKEQQQLLDMESLQAKRQSM